jgi:alkanesulfonate monooxygenase SsuD/methylene tetrahydromethanopterin reductase-like flavin-dependent oxidoreductase (luciferase family)
MGKHLQLKLPKWFLQHSKHSEDAQLFYQRVKQQAQSFGRLPNTLAVMPGVMPFIGKSESEAQENSSMNCLDNYKVQNPRYWNCR